MTLAGRIRMIRSHNWKLIAEEGGTGELYDLRNDPHELVNLWHHPPYKHNQDELQLHLSNWLAQICKRETS